MKKKLFIEGFIIGLFVGAFAAIMFFFFVKI